MTHGGHTGEFSFLQYLSSGPGLEAVSWATFDTQIYLSGVTSKLRFFDGPRPSQGEGWTNMYFGHMLPNPQALLVKSILLFGITSNIALGEFTFTVGNKMMKKNPAWLHSLRPAWKFEAGVFIPPMMHFTADLRWEAPQDLGAGVTGKPKTAAVIQCCLVGTLARPIC